MTNGNVPKPPEWLRNVTGAHVLKFSLLSVLGIFVLLVLLSTGLMAQWLSYLWPTVYYTEIFADVTAEGQRYQLTSVAKCTLRAKARFFGLVGGPTPATITGGLLVKRLPSGAGLIIVGPVICDKYIWERFRSDDEKKNIVLAKYLRFSRSGVKPQVVWLDNAENPTRIIGYWNDYLSKPGASVKVHSISIKRKYTSWLESMDDPEEEIPWLEGQSNQRARLVQAGDWLGFYLTAYNEDAWSQVENLFLRGETEIVEIDWDKIKPITSNQSIFAEYKNNYNINIDSHRMEVNLEQFNIDNQGFIVFRRRSEFLIYTAYEHQFNFVFGEKKFKNNQKWMYYPDKKLIFIFNGYVFGVNYIYQFGITCEFISCL